MSNKLLGLVVGDLDSVMAGVCHVTDWFSSVRFGRGTLGCSIARTWRGAKRYDAGRVNQKVWVGLDWGRSGLIRAEPDRGSSEGIRFRHRVSSNQLTRGTDGVGVDGWVV